MIRSSKVSLKFLNPGKARILGTYLSEYNRVLKLISKELRIENIRNLGRHKRLPRLLKHFTYQEIFDRLEQTAESQGVPVTKVSPVYTSQRCSCCGWTRRSNRKGKQFICGSCGFIGDADLNAALNIRSYLRPIGTRGRLEHRNSKGFFWDFKDPGQEPIVPVVPGTEDSNKILSIQ